MPTLKSGHAAVDWCKKHGYIHLHQGVPGAFTGPDLKDQLIKYCLAKDAGFPLTVRGFTPPLSSSPLPTHLHLP